ncbi:MAG: SH3 domain-containing protein [Lewinellaceae bacterium]|nr:SH3 domain-containing protein [Lewinellaceae bacterium]
MNVRIAPNKDAQVVTQLLAGEPVTILSSASEQFTQNGWTTNWVKIGFEKNGKRQDGYVWGGVLGFHALQAGDVSFVYAVVKKEGNETEGSEKYRVEIRAIRQQQIISSVTTTIGIGAGYDTEAALYGNLGMKAYQNVIRLDFPLAHVVTINMRFVVCGMALNC